MLFPTGTLCFSLTAGWRHCTTAIWTGVLPHLQASGIKGPIRTEAGMGWCIDFLACEWRKEVLYSSVVMVHSGLVALQVGRICWQIGERAMVPKDVRELLYQLLKDHYVQVQVCYSLDVAKLTPLLWKDLYLSNALVLAPVTFSLQSFWASRYWALVFKYRNDSLFSSLWILLLCFHLTKSISTNIQHVTLH